MSLLSKLFGYPKLKTTRKNNRKSGRSRPIQRIVLKNGKQKFIKHNP